MPIQRWSNDIWVVQLADEPLLSEDLTTALEELGGQELGSSAVRAKRAPDLVLDLTAVTYVNSSNLSQLLRLRQAGIRRHARLCLAAASPELWHIFMVTGLDKIFTFAQDVPTALAGLQMKKGE